MKTSSAEHGAQAAEREACSFCLFPFETNMCAGEYHDNKGSTASLDSWSALLNNKQDQQATRARRHPWQSSSNEQIAGKVCHLR